jgi:hypothetical protein
MCNKEIQEDIMHITNSISIPLLTSRVIHIAAGEEPLMGSDMSCTATVYHVTVTEGSETLAAAGPIVGWALQRVLTQYMREW